MTPSSKVDKSMYSHHHIFSKHYVGMSDIPLAMIDIGSFFNIIDGLLGSSEVSSVGNVGMPLVLKNGSIGCMGIPAVSVGGPGCKIRGQ